MNKVLRAVMGIPYVLLEHASRQRVFILRARMTIGFEFLQ